MRTPIKQEIFHSQWVKAKWNVSGLFIFDTLIEKFVKILDNYDSINPIISVHGSPSALWNSGRVIDYRLDMYKLANIIDLYSTLDIDIFLTFSNHLIEEEHLSDKTCNILLQTIAAKGNNGVIISSDILNEYIKKEYPTLKRYSSIVKIATEESKGNFKRYEALSKEYDRVIIHPDDNFNYTLLNQISTDLNMHNFEIIVNENCIPNCHNRSKHYTLISQDALYHTPISTTEYDDFMKNDCQTRKTFQKNYLLFGKGTCNLSQFELARIYSLGFRNFKLQGRTDTDIIFLFDLCRYLLEHDFSMSHIFKSMILT